MSMLNVLLFSGAIQGIFLSVILYFSLHGSRYANRVLSVFLTTFSLSIILHILGHTGHLETLPQHKDIIILLVYLYSPLLYLYTSVLTGEKREFRLKYSLHFIPFLTASILTVFIICLKQYTPGNSSAVSILELLIHAAIIPQCFIYLGKIFFLIKAHSKKVEQIYSSTERVNLRWLTILLALIVLFICIDGILYLLVSSDQGDFLWFFVSCYMYLIGYFALRQPEIFFFSVQKTGTNETNFNSNSVEKSQEGTVKTKYKKSTLSETQGLEIKNKLIQSLEVQKVYLTEELSLPALAAELSVSVHHLSQVINEHFKMNFFELINSMRIEEAKCRILDANNQSTVLNIAFDVGFNSLSAFNSAFKRFTGKTPSQYKAESGIQK